MRNQPKSFYLFVSLLVMLMLYPLALSSEWTQLLFRMTFTLAVLGGVYTISDNRRALHIGLALAVPSLLANALVFFYTSPTLIIASMVLAVIYFIFLEATLLQHVLRDHQVNADTIYTAMAVYMLMAVLFAALYTLVEFVWPGSFKGEFHPNKFFKFAFADGFYFSVCTLTTVGFGDVLPYGAEARALAMLESMMGVLYPAVLISRLVGLHASNTAPRD